MVGFPVLLVILLFDSSSHVRALSLPAESKSRKSSSSSSSARRDLLRQTAITTLGSAGAIFWRPSSQNDPSTAAIAAEKSPFAIVGANGRTGALCVTACLERNLPVRALTRSGSWTAPPLVDGTTPAIDPVSNPLLTVVACDIKDTNALQQSLKGCQAVIYAASASKNGGNSQEIDHVGVVEAARICADNHIPRYVVLSSTATTRPNSLGYKFTNVLGGIMDEKRLGEVEVQQVYLQKGDGLSSFTILRPGGLEEPKRNEVLGPGAIELSQGDALAGIISRADLAQVTVETAVARTPNLRNTAVEVYYTSSAQPCERKFRDLLKADSIVPRLHGETYAELLAGVQPNVDYYIPGSTSLNS